MDAILIAIFISEIQAETAFNSTSNSFYAIITTFFLNKLTRASEKQYYEDVLDIVELHTILYNNVEYRVLIIIFQVLLLLSWFQIIQKLAKQKYKRIIAIVTGVLMAAFSGCFIYYQVEYNTEGEFTWKIFQACIFDGRLLGVL